MNLFINAVSSDWMLILFNNSRQIIDKIELHILWNESSKLTKFVDEFLWKNKLNYNELKNIVAVNWPWSFTWVRIISLIVNTIAFTNYDIKLTDINFFSLFEKYPIIKSSSKRDLFVKKTKSNKIEIIKNEKFLDFIKNIDIKEIYWDLSNSFIKWEIEINSKIDYKKIISNIKFDNKKIIEPLYIKKPNIS
jgi:tRNA A37 threonylcarbamoyladenosine modification protein TsaB